MTEAITVNTGLNSFILVDKIIQAEEKEISGTKIFNDAPLYLGLESLAQLGAFHVRYLSGFERHAFLMKIDRYLMSEKQGLNGEYALSGRLVSRSASAFSYALQAKKGNDVSLEGGFLFATVDYDKNFKKEILEEHYKNVFLCLQNDSKKD